MGAMNRIVNGTHPDVQLEDADCVIFSSKIIPGNEKKLYYLQNLIVKNKIEMISEENAFVHVSGHPNREDLKDMYKWVKPQCVIPVHGEHRHMAEHVSFAKEMQIPKSLLIENGDIIKLLPGNKPEIIDKAPSGKIYLDGSVNVETDSQSIKDRKNLSINGYLEITLIVLPVFTPLVAGLDFGDHLPKEDIKFWFIILLAVNLQTSFLTPPFGFALFYMKGIAPREIKIQSIYKGIIPFVILQALGVITVLVFPGIALGLMHFVHG